MAPKTVKLLKPVSDAQLIKLLDERLKLLVAKSEATRDLRTKLVELQAELDEAERPFVGKLEKIEAVAKATIIERGGAYDLQTDTTIDYRSSYTRRKVDLDGLWSLQEDRPKVWEIIEPYCTLTEVSASVSFKD